MKVYCKWEGCLFYQFSTIFNSLHSTYWLWDKLFKIMDGPKDRPFSYTKRSAVQFSAGYGSCKSVFSHLFRNLYKLAVSRRFSFPFSATKDDEVNKEVALFHVGHVREINKEIACSIWNICFACNPHPNNLWRGGGGGLKRSWKVSCSVSFNLGSNSIMNHIAWVGLEVATPN